MPDLGGAPKTDPLAPRKGKADEAADDGATRPSKLTGGEGCVRATTAEGGRVCGSLTASETDGRPSAAAGEEVLIWSIFDITDSLQFVQEDGRRRLRL